MIGKSVEFFDRQFERQIGEGDYRLNPFERAVLPHLYGEVLDLGCGLGNLALAAARAGCKVTALDASPTATADLARRARGLPLEARVAELRDWMPHRAYDCVVAIGLLMFFPCPQARRQLTRIREAVRPNGIAAVNVLIEGTTYMDMFDPDDYCLLTRDELTAAFADWQTVLSRHDDFAAPGSTIKRFHTLVARAPR